MTTYTIGIREERRTGAASSAADWICLAATPTFAVMAIVTGIFDTGPQYVLCVGVQGTSPLSGMVWMYLLMSAFHSTPWLRLISRRSGGVRRS